MKKIRILLAFCITSILLLQCGGNPETDGDSAYNAGKYNQALSYYLEVKKSQPKSTKINEKIALTYMQKGQALFKKRKNLDAFISNFEKGQEFIPELEGSPEFNKAYSELLYQMALAYNNTAPSNEIQKEQYFNRTLQCLEDALIYDPANMEADATLAEIKTANFQKMFDKGMLFFSKAKKEKRNGDLFLTAERYLRQAASFDPQNAEAQKKLVALRRKTISIIDMNKDFPLALGDYKYAGKYLLIAFTAVNNTGEKIDFDPARVKLVDLEDNAYSFDAEQTAKYDDGLTEISPLEVRKQIDGTLSFALGKSVKLKMVTYELADGRVMKKYFP